MKTFLTKTVLALAAAAKMREMKKQMKKHAKHLSLEEKLIVGYIGDVNRFTKRKNLRLN